MDQVKIGRFIASQRKCKNLTQIQLAELVGVTDRAVSKWETGRSLPDYSALPTLCEVLGISINELLCGEKLTMENNDTKHEQLLLDMTKELQQKNKTIWRTLWIIMSVGIVALLACLLVAGLLLPEGPWQLVMIVASCVVFLIPCFYALKLEVSVGFYKCKHCGHEIVPTYKEALNAMHMGTTRYLKCPNCNQKSWCKKVVDKKD